MIITIASTNLGKIKELKNILKDYSALNLNIKSIETHNIIEPDEPYNSFMKNAIHKAKYYAGFTNTTTLSEDAGLCIEALDNFPGVKTKDFVMESGGLNQAFMQLKNMLANKKNYRAHFVCAAALYFPQSNTFITHQGLDHGTISFPPRGNLGIGFDPIFIPQDHNKTMAELGETVKKQISHRSIALRGIMDKLQANINLLSL